MTGIAGTRRLRLLTRSTPPDAAHVGAHGAHAPGATGEPAHRRLPVRREPRYDNKAVFRTQRYSSAEGFRAGRRVVSEEESFLGEDRPTLHTRVRRLRCVTIQTAAAVEPWTPDRPGGCCGRSSTPVAAISCRRSACRPRLGHRALARAARRQARAIVVPLQRVARTAPGRRRTRSENGGHAGACSGAGGDRRRIAEHRPALSDA
jgi:hypothetical protein